MVSRETTVHLAALGLALAILVVASAVDLDTGSGTTSGALFLVCYGLALAGAHLYLAVRGEDGMVPVEARWRYVTMIAVLLAVGAAVLFGGDRTVATIELETIGTAVALGTIGAYFAAESLAGYRDSRSA